MAVKENTFPEIEKLLAAVAEDGAALAEKLKALAESDEPEPLELPKSTAAALAKRFTQIEKQVGKESAARRKLAEARTAQLVVGLREEAEKLAERLKAAEKPDPGESFLMTGRISDSGTKRGLPAVEVVLMSPGAEQEIVGRSKTDPFGDYLLQVPAEAIELVSSRSRFKLRVHDAAGRGLADSKTAFAVSAGKTRVENFAVAGSTLPQSVAAAERVAEAVQGRLVEIDRRESRLLARVATRLELKPESKVGRPVARAKIRRAPTKKAAAKKSPAKAKPRKIAVQRKVAAPTEAPKKAQAVKKAAAKKKAPAAMKSSPGKTAKPRKVDRKKTAGKRGGRNR